MWKETIKLESGLVSRYYEQDSQKDTLGNAKSAVKANSLTTVANKLPQLPPSFLQFLPRVLLVWADRPSSDAGNPSPWTCDWKDNISKNRPPLKTAH